MTAALLPFPVVVPCSETLTWNTGILTSADGSEQRVARRVPPVQSITYQLICSTAAEGVELVNLLHGSLKDEQAIPIWPEAERASGSLAAGATAISVDTRLADYRAAGHAIVYLSPACAEVVDVATVTDNGLTLSPGVVNAYSDRPWIMPCRSGYITAAAAHEAHSSDLSIVEVKYEVTDNIEITGYTAALTYDSLEVLTTPSRSTDSTFHISYDGDVTIIDAGIGTFKAFSMGDFNIASQNHAVFNNTKALTWSFRQWLHSIVGRQKTFLVPTWRPDFILSRDCGASDTSIYVVTRGYRQNLGATNAMRTYLAFQPAGATIIPRKITGFSTVGTTEEKIDLLTAPGMAFAAGSELSWVDRCRLASDTVTINWIARGENKCSLRLVRVAA